MIELNQIRNLFTDFFAKHNHNPIPSSPLIPENNPTLLFTNAGMVQFKDYFVGNKKPEFTSAVSIQKCLRAGGKHNDLANVGYTNRHHTFFEMAGNFSFGGYGKEQAIILAWKFISQELSLLKEKLYVTVYRDDNETADLWRKILPANKIISISTADNFWSMGEVGPCGPCTEIFYDNGSDIPGDLPGSKNENGDRFVEIWNLVFMEYNRDKNGNKELLPEIGVDTGMGLERISAVMQGVIDNYDTDLFKELIKHSKMLLGNNDNKTAHKIITDHLRASSFLIADGVNPGNQGRGYVLRRIIRRAMSFAYRLRYKKPILCRLFPVLADLMGKAYPELNFAAESICRILQTEEENFLNTLSGGFAIFNKVTEKVKSGTLFPGEEAFKLYDTYGFPLDITTDLLWEKNINVDEIGFTEAMNKQKKQAKDAWVGSGEKCIEEIQFKIAEKYGKTRFIEKNDIECKILAILVGNEILSTVDEYKNIAVGDKITVILDKTPFYAESGGQLGDIGILTIGNVALEVIDTKKILNSVHGHVCILESGIINGTSCLASFDKKKRNSLRAAHSATHLLHFALRKILGKHVTQKGSLVAEDRLRFDFNHSKALTIDELRTTEEETNALIRANNQVETEVMPKEQARKKGATALFSEKYDDLVRVITMGDSIEFCGGSHVKSTGEIGIFVITKESSIGSGLRRIEGLTRDKALAFFREKEQQYLDEINNYKKQIKEEVKKAKANENKLYAQIIKNIESQTEEVNGIKLITKIINDIPTNAVKKIVIKNIKNNKNSIILFLTGYEKKSILFIAVTKDLTTKADANELIRVAAVAMKIKGGGGKQDLAQCSANTNFFAKATIEIKKYLSTKIN
ncbi:MAG: alanine--tRNA ligase [Rickettsiaceae bacterium H1]|nr:alanine--tRNA ligase [Rickettsiaceae bacterium H1]